MTMGGGIGRLTHHPEYYVKDGSVSFLTDDRVLFKVHRSYFERESQVFRKLFEDAAEDDLPTGTDAFPLTLDVKAEEFAQLCWVWYDKDYSRHQQTKENWLTILSLATRWEFDKIRELALREIEALELPPAERISIYNGHGISGERVVSSFVELCKSPTVPTEADAHLLQMESLIQLLQAREDAQRKAVMLGHNSPTSACLEDNDLKEIVSNLLLRTGLDFRSGGTSTGSEDQAPDQENQRTHKKTVSAPTLKTPQFPHRTTKSVSGSLSHENNPLQEDRVTKESQEQQKQEAESKKMMKEEGTSEAKDKKQEEKEDKAKPTQELEKAKQNRETAKEKETKKTTEQKTSNTSTGTSGRRPGR